jgi:hypothetical protein
MSVRIKNLTPRPLQVELTSGSSLRLSPGQSSPELHEVEISNNAKIDKLQVQHLIAIEILEAPGQPQRAAKQPVGVGQPQAAEAGESPAADESAGTRRAKR